MNVNQHNRSQRDALLWQQTLQGNEDAFSQLYLIHRPLLVHYGQKLGSSKSLSEDCIQELFCNLYLKKEEYSHIRHIKTYLFISFRRDLLKKLAKERKLDIYDVNSGKPDIHFTQEDLWIQKEEDIFQHKLLTHLLNTLSPRQKEILYLKYYNGLDNKEISDVLNITYQVTHNIIYKAFKKLRRASREKKINFF